MLKFEHGSRMWRSEEMVILAGKWMKIWKKKRQDDYKSKNVAGCVPADNLINSLLPYEVNDTSIEFFSILFLTICSITSFS